jgi:SAM-dependent methyltransferase
MLLRPDQRLKFDPSDDLAFYAVPRFVTHVDAGFIQQLSDLYRERLRPNMRILDLMSSWVSHLPTDITFEHVEGHGMNPAELARNPQLDHYFVQDLNHNPQLPLADQSFDAVLCTVSVQYLQYPEAVFNEVHRVLKPDGIAIVSFSNRMFYQKAIAAWRDGSEGDRVNLVQSYFASVSGLSAPEVVSRAAQVPAVLRLLGWGGGDPFYAVLAQRSR